MIRVRFNLFRRHPDTKRVIVLLARHEPYFRPAGELIAPLMTTLLQVRLIISYYDASFVAGVTIVRKFGTPSFHLRNS